MEVFLTVVAAFRFFPKLPRKLQREHTVRSTFAYYFAKTRVMFPLSSRQKFRVILIGGLYFHTFHVFFAQFFNLPGFQDFSSQLH